jgi:1-acyl-sn-glycerol-3-phosphate acyltransferase
VATASTQLEHSAVRERVLEIVRALLSELGSSGALPMLSPSSNFDRDLGLGSLERVELLARVELAFGIRLPDGVSAEINSPDDLARAILSAPAADAHLEVSAASLGGSASVQQLHRTESDQDIFATQTLIEVLRYRAQHDAERVHLHITEDSEAGEQTLTFTFAELYSAAQLCAAELARRGVPPGGRVSLMLPTSRAFFISYAGILLAGAIPVPIYPPLRADRIEEYAQRQSAILNNAGVCLLLTFRRAESVAKLLRPRVRSLESVVDVEKLLAAADNALQPAPGALPVHLYGTRVRTANDIALLQYTSGSTGDPKGVILTHSNLLANIRAIGQAVQLTSADVGVSWLPLYHDMGLIGAWLTLLHYGTLLCVMSPLAFLTRPERWLQAFHKHGGTISAAPNFAYELCVRKISDGQISGIDLGSWRAALNGAEPVNPETLQRFEERFSKFGFRREAQLPVYGLAEASLAVTFPPLNRGPRIDYVDREAFTAQGVANSIQPSPSAIAFVSSGKPVLGHEVCIVDEAGNAVPDRIEGFLWFRGPSATSGYYNNPQATEKLFPRGPSRNGEFPWVNSGDRGYRADEEIFVTGRVKDIIIKGGRNLYPHEVEELAARVDGVRKGCVVAFGVKDQSSGTEKLIVVAETRENHASRRAAIANAINLQISQGLGLPADRVELIPPGGIPKTSSGKLRREETRALFSAGSLSAERTPAWVQIARLGATGTLKNLFHMIAAAFRRAVQITYGIYVLALFAIWIIPAWFGVLFFHDPRTAGHYTSATIRTLFFLAGIRMRVSGKEHMNTPGVKIYASNHTSYIDVLALMAALRVSYRFVAKSEVHQMPFIGTFLRKMGHLSFVRSDANARRDAAQQIESALRAGDSVFVFPEGTFVPQSGIRPFQLGAFNSAVSIGAPIIPVSLSGTREFLRDGTYFPRPAIITITLSPPLYPASPLTSSSASDWHEVVRLRDATRQQIAHNCGEPLV